MIQLVLSTDGMKNITLAALSKFLNVTQSVFDGEVTMKKSPANPLYESWVSVKFTINSHEQAHL